MNFILLQAAAGASTSGKGGASQYSFIILMAGDGGTDVLYQIRPQKKRQEGEQEMRSSLEIGDEIITIGGIVGKVVTIREEDLIIETGADRNKMRIQRWAVNTNKTKAEQHQKEVEAAREAAKNKKNKKNKDDALTEKSDTAKEAEEKIEK